MERNDWRFFKEQADRFGDEIDRILRSIDYGTKVQVDAFDDIPF
jgi:hypothetical protein